MKAVYYDIYGPANDVLTLGEMVDPEPGPGEVLVRVKATAVNPSDVKLRAGLRPGTPMEFPRIVPHSDGAGVIEAVGDGVKKSRVGERVWIWNAQWGRAFGTAAELCAVPSEQAVRLPDRIGFAEGASFGIPAMTAWYALFANGFDLQDKTVLVTGGAGRVGRYACQMARLAGARVITTVSSEEKARHSTNAEWVNYLDGNVVGDVLDLTDGERVDLIVEVDFAAGQDAAVKLLKPGGTIAAYACSSHMTPDLQFYPLMFSDVTLRMLVVYRMADDLRRTAEAQLTEWLEGANLNHSVIKVGGLENIIYAHETVEAGDKMGTVVLEP